MELADRMRLLASKLVELDEDGGNSISEEEMESLEGKVEDIADKIYAIENRYEKEEEVEGEEEEEEEEEELDGEEDE